MEDIAGLCVLVGIGTLLVLFVLVIIMNMDDYSVCPNCRKKIHYKNLKNCQEINNPENC